MPITPSASPRLTASGGLEKPLGRGLALRKLVSGVSDLPCLRSPAVIEGRVTSVCRPGSAIIRCTLLMLAVSVTSHATDFTQCDGVLTPYEAVYVSAYETLELAGQRRLMVDESGGVVLSQTAGRLGSRISETSILEWADGQLRVRSYDRRQRIFGMSREQQAVFDWSRGTIKVSGRREGELPIDGQSFDPLSYQLALRCNIAQGLEQTSYRVIRGAKLKTYHFRLHGAETIETRQGPLDTVVVERVRDDEERSTRIWFAPSLNYLLVRLEQEDKADGIDVSLRLETVEFR
jgi:hypothetical protein